jgi:polysaccharide export outer membrane protein
MKKNMQKLCLWLVIVAGLCTSCRSYKEVTMLADVDKAAVLESMPSPMSNYKLRERDNLFVSIVTSNAEQNRTYNPAQAGTPATTNNNYEGETNRKIYGYEVDASGNINLPLLGTFAVAGKTVREAEEMVLTKSKALFKDVTTKIRLLNYKVTVVGEVKRPGVFFNSESDFTVMDAIGKAEGITEFALLNEVLVLRPSSNGRQETFVMDLTNRSSLRNNGFYLLPNDTVIIKPGKNKNKQMNTQQQNWIIPAVSAVLLFINVFRNN